MARIRTIKPAFFTSEQIVDLSPMARLFFIATWCEADREGRMSWKPRTFKMRYFPADDCDIEALARELIDSGLVVLYGDRLAYIPSFSRHQCVNPRETKSTLPDPERSRVDHASARVSDAQGGRKEGKEGKEKNAEEDPHARSWDFKADLFARWKSVPGSGGGAFLSKLLRDHKPEQRVLEAVEHTLSDTRADPKGFVIGCLNKPRTGSMLDDDAESARAIVRAQDFSGCL
jgi:hypothetical protein